MIYEVAIQYAKKGISEKQVVFGPKSVVANDKLSAVVKAVVENMNELENIDTDCTRVFVRPFA